MTMRNLGLSLALSMGVIAFYANTASAQFIDITAGGLSYTQNFNTLTQNTVTASQFVNGTADATGTLGEGVYAFIGGSGARSTGATLDDTPILGGTGSSNTGGLYSFGASGNGDRALGTLLSGTATTPFFGFRFQNLTGGTITGFTVSYDGEQYRRGDAGRQDRLDFQYSTTATTVNGAGFVDADALDFVSAAGLTPNVALTPAVTTAIGPQTITLGTPLANGGSLFLRFSDFNATGADDGLAVDNFNFTAVVPVVVVPEASTFALIAPVLGVLGVVVARRRKLA